MFRRTIRHVIASSATDAGASSRGGRRAVCSSGIVGVHPSSSRTRARIAEQQRHIVRPEARRIDVHADRDARARDEHLEHVAEWPRRGRSRRCRPGPDGRAPRSARYARTVSRTSVRSRRASRLPTTISGGCSPASIAAICRANPDVEKAGSCRGPKWLNARAMVTCTPGAEWRARRAPAPACSAPYGLAGTSGWSSVSGSLAGR